MKNNAERSMVRAKPLELFSLEASVDKILLFDTLKHTDLQFTIDTTTHLDTILHNI